MCTLKEAIPLVRLVYTESQSGKPRIYERDFVVLPIVELPPSRDDGSSPESISWRMIGRKAFCLQNLRPHAIGLSVTVNHRTRSTDEKETEDNDGNPEILYTHHASRHQSTDGGHQFGIRITERINLSVGVARTHDVEPPSGVQSKIEVVLQSPGAKEQPVAYSVIISTSRSRSSSE